jgi:hypothetical protein
MINCIWILRNINQGTKENVVCLKATKRPTRLLKIKMIDNIQCWQVFGGNRNLHIL